MNVKINVICFSNYKNYSEDISHLQINQKYIYIMLYHFHFKLQCGTSKIIALKFTPKDANVIFLLISISTTNIQEFGLQTRKIDDP